MSSTSWSSSCSQVLARARSERCSVGFAGADAYGVIEVENEDLAVADLAGLCRAGDGVDHLVGLLTRDRDLDFDFRQEVHRVFGAAVNFGVAFLSPVSLDFSDGETVHPRRSESVSHFVELEWLDDGHDDFHGFNPPLGPGGEPGVLTGQSHACSCPRTIAG